MRLLLFGCTGFVGRELLPLLLEAGHQLTVVSRRLARGFGLSLYHCLSQVEDALAELDRYTLGYVDGYLHDGREMLREAKQRRQRLQDERRRLEIV